MEPNQQNKQTSKIEPAEKEQTDSNQRGGRRGITGERRGRVIKEHVQMTRGQSQRGEGWRVDDGWWRWVGGAGKMETTVVEQ